MFFEIFLNRMHFPNQKMKIKWQALPNMPCRAMAWIKMDEWVCFFIIFLRPDSIASVCVCVCECRVPTWELLNWFCKQTTSIASVQHSSNLYPLFKCTHQCYAFNTQTHISIDIQQRWIWCSIDLLFLLLLWAVCISKPRTYRTIKLV